jgi:hypothetical protein
MTTEFLHSMKTRWEDTTSLITPDDDRCQVITQYIGVIVHASHWATASVGLQVVEDVRRGLGKGSVNSPLSSIEARHWGETSSYARWEVMESIEACRIVSISMGLVRGEVVGEARERAIYDLIYAAVRDSEPVKKWVTERWPEWAILIMQDPEDEG